MIANLWLPSFDIELTEVLGFIEGRFVESV